MILNLINAKFSLTKTNIYAVKKLLTNEESIIENKEFIIAFIKHFEADVKKLTRKFKTNKSNIVFCIDCPRCEIWRNDIYDKYKQSRIKKDNFNNDIFDLFEDYEDRGTQFKQAVRSL